MQRTPYSVEPYGGDNYRTDLPPADSLARAGFIFVYQDVRGRYPFGGGIHRCAAAQNASGRGDGTDPGTDTYDSIDWLVKNIRTTMGGLGCGAFPTRDFTRHSD